MKIQCQSCQAKYTIADEKVLGKVVKIRCKKCSSTIVINGNEQAHADDAIGASTDVFDYANQSNDPWTVNVADGDQRTMTIQEIVAEYKTGVVNDETYCWKDGMADWLPLREVEAISIAVKGGTKMAEELSVSPQSIPPPSTAAGAPASLFGGRGGGGGADSPFAAHGNGNGNGNGVALPTALFGGGGAVEQSVPAAARRAGGRGQGGDLFGNVEKAGGEDDVMTSAARAAMAAGAASDEKLTGQRNENSVLFSLSSLTDKKDAPAGNRTTATADGSGLIDIRALSANMDDSDKSRDKGARVDDIMNLSGGGAFGAALAAPILAPPPLETVDLGVTNQDQPRQSKTLIFAILGGCAFIAIAIVAVAALLRTPTPDPTTRPPGTSGSGALDTTPTSTVATNDTNTPQTGTTAPANTDTPPPPGTGAKPGTTPGGHTGTTARPGAVAAAHDNTPAPQPAAPVAPAKPASLDDAMGQSLGRPAATAATGGGAASTAPFDRGAAQASLGGINVASCKSNGGPTGQGHVTVTFTPDGSVASAVVDQGPFPGTTVGGCVAGKFRGAHVPAFGGAPVRVGKSFSIM